MVKKKTCIFISGNGSNLNALISNSRQYNFPLKINLIVTNKKDAGGIKLAKKYSIPFIVINTKESLFETKLLNSIKEKQISTICLAGYMKILSKKFIKNFKGNIINIHPSLLPKYKGVNIFKRVLKNNEKISGCTVHHVNSKLDSGKIILKKHLLVSKNETELSLKKKTQKVEHRAFSEAIIRLFMMRVSF